MQRAVNGPDRDWLTLEQCAEYMGIGSKTLERLVATGEFPPGVSISKTKRVWGWLDVVAYMHLASRRKSAGETVVEDQD